MSAAQEVRSLRAWLMGLVLVLSATGVLATDLNDAGFISQSGMPGTTVPGQVYAVSMTFQNTGNTTWSAGGTYRLAANGVSNDTTWGLSRVELPGSVAPGASVTFSFNATAPSVYGSYNFKWRMVKDDVSALFGAQSTLIGVQNGINAAQFISHTMPASTTPGGNVYAVTVTMKNTGNTTWTTGTQYRLGAIDPSWWTTTEAALPNAVAPGENATFSFNITSPSAWGTYPIRWIMRMGTGWFGAMTEGSIANGVNESQFVSQSVPATMNAGQSYPVSITMKNTSGTNWTASNTYGLGAVVAWNTNPWGVTRVAMPGSVAPNQNVTFSFNVTAPSAPGTYNFEWKMLRDEINNWFGDLTPIVAVNVQAANTLYFIHPDHLNTPRLVADATGTTVWRWDHAEPFGVNVPDENPSALGVFDLPLRLPGQYYDKETNNHYNYFRDYDPSIGRYVESDPIGLDGGINTYAYAVSRPLQFFDSDGLEVQLICRWLTGFAQFSGKQHCFVRVTCPPEGWDTTLSLFASGSSAFGIPNRGKKAQDDKRDDASAATPFNRTAGVNFCASDQCAYEKAILGRFRSFPEGDVPYRMFGPNSNNFASDLLTGSGFSPTPFASPGPNTAPGIGMPHPSFPKR